MRNFSPYEHIAILVPGSVLLTGIVLLQPDLKALLAKDGVTVGGFGVYLLIAYALGHLLAAFGNLIETALWKPFGGMPSVWLVKPDNDLLSEVQIQRIESLLRERLSLEIGRIREMSAAEWGRIFHQLYRDVLAHGAGRTEAFNGAYGLNRGLVAATTALAVLILVAAPEHWAVALALLGAASAYTYRMYRAGRTFALEVLNRFLVLPPKSKAEPKARTPRAPKSTEAKSEP